MTPSTPTTYTPVVTVQNVWAVRGFTASGQIRVDPAITNANATVGSSSTVTLTNLQVQSSGVSAGDPIDVDAPGLFSATLGDIIMTLNISGVTDSDAHTGMQYTITATATP